MDKLGQVTAGPFDPGRYRSYLVRLWRESPGSPWRCQVSCLGTGLERRLACLAELFEFLLADAGGGEGETGRQEDVAGEEGQTAVSR